MINNLKRQIFEYKAMLNSKEDELMILKNNSKVAKYHDLDFKLKNTMEELNGISERYNLIKNTMTE
jgi:hypothetical protein